MEKSRVRILIRKTRAYDVFNLPRHPVISSGNTNRQNDRIRFEAISFTNRSLEIFIHPLNSRLMIAFSPDVKIVFTE